MCKPDNANDIAEPANIKHWLYHLIEVETDFKYHEKTDDQHRQALRAIVQDKGNSLRELGDIAVVVSILDDDEQFDFDSALHYQLPVEVELYPMVVMMLYKRNENKCFVRGKTELTKYDGVTLLHAMFCMLEYLENGKCSPYPFSTSNPAPPENQFENFQKQLDRVEKAKRAAKFSPSYWLGKWTRSPLMGQLESKLPAIRPARRFTQVTASYKEIMGKIDEVKAMLKIPFYALTVNYSPMGAVSLCPTLEEAMSKKCINANIALPPKGVGPPAPMDEAQVAMLFNTVFLNNYGKHKPQFSGKVVGHVWDWSGIYTSFAPFFFVTTIQDKVFFNYSASPADFDVIEKSGIFDNIGTGRPFRYHPFYVREDTDVSSDVTSLTD